MICLDTVWDRFRHVSLPQLAQAAALLTLGGFAGAASWFRVLRTRFPELTYRSAAVFHWKGMFFNSFLPSNVGGDVVKGYIVARDRGQTGFVVTSLLVDRAINLGMLVCIGVIAFLLHAGHIWGAAAFLLLVFLSAAGAMACARSLRARLSVTDASGWRAATVRGLDAVCELTASPRRLFPVLAAAFASQFLKTWQNLFVLRALSLAIPEACIWSVIPLFGVVSALPISIGGLGVREMVAQHISAPLGIDPSQLVAFSLASQLTVVLVNMLGVLAFLWKTTPRATSRP